MRESNRGREKEGERARAREREKAGDANKVLAITQHGRLSRRVAVGLNLVAACDWYLPEHVFWTEQGGWGWGGEEGVVG